MIIKAIIFDMDGTILDTIDDISNAVNYAMKIHDYNEKTVLEVKKALGRGGENLIKDLLPNDINHDKFLKVFTTYQNYYEKNSQVLTKPFPNIMKLLEVLKSENYLLFVVSNKFQNLVEDLNKIHFKNLFTEAIGERSDLKIKPNPDMLLYVLNKYNLKNEDVLFVGDSEIDILTAKNANIKVCAVTWGFRDLYTLEQLNPNFLVNDPLEILDVIKR